MVRFIGSPGLRWAARATSGLQRIMISDWLQSRATSWRSGRMARNSGPSRRAGSLTALRSSGVDLAPVEPPVAVQAGGEHRVHHAAIAVLLHGAGHGAAHELAVHRHGEVGRRVVRLLDVEAR